MRHYPAPDYPEKGDHLPNARHREVIAEAYKEGRL